MAVPSSQEITVLLNRWSQGDEHALKSLIPLVYPDLRALAAYLMRGERQGHTLQPSALVNEAYVKLDAARRVLWQDRAHFIAVAARAMRQILVDYARKHNCEVRGGGLQKIPLDEAFIMDTERSATLLVIDEALEHFAGKYPRHAKVVELRFFGGLTNPEIGNVLQISPNTVIRYWDFSKAWLRKYIEDGKPQGKVARRKD